MPGTDAGCALSQQILRSSCRLRISRSTSRCKPYTFIPRKDLKKSVSEKCGPSSDVHLRVNDLSS